MVSRRKVLLAGPVLALGIVGMRASAQQPYPTKLIKVVVGNAPGGTDDLISRFVVKTMQSEFGQTALVENRGGASTTIAGAAVASSPPDGYTILCLINTSIVQTVLKEKLPYSLKSFTPIIGVGGFPLALAVSPALKVTNFDEFKALAKSKDGVTYASGGVGTMAHLNTIRLLKAIDGHGTHVTYKNNPDGLQALAGGFTDVMLASASEVAYESSLVVAIAHSNDLAVDLNKDTVSKGDARSKWCAYKTAVTEGRVDASVGIVPHRSEVGRPSFSKPGLSNGDNVAVCLERNGKSA